MARRISSSQLQSKLRQAQRQAESRFRREVNKLNHQIRTYNSKARAHNLRVRANRERLRRELQRLARSKPRPQYVTYRTSVEAVRRSYVSLEKRAEANTYGNRLDPFLDLSERETANSVSVMNALQGDVPENETEASSIDHILDLMSQDVRDRWYGALYALNPRNPDAARHFCTSARELLTNVLERFAGDNEVKADLSNCELTEQGKPTRRAKIHYLLKRHGIADDAIIDFANNDMENVIELFRALNKGTHGSPGHFDSNQLLAFRARVEGAVSFLYGIVTGNAFA